MTTEALRDQLLEALERSESWMRAIAQNRELTPWQCDHIVAEADTLVRLRNRAASTLINVAALGKFSSGKSFLLSGIQRQLEAHRVKSKHDGRPSDKYVSLLPSATNPSTACPVSLVPVGLGNKPDASCGGFLRVQFVDTGEWEDVGSSPRRSIVTAYVDQDADRADRLSQHVERTVAAAEILLADPPLLAKFYDLPGHSSPDPVHDQVIRTSMSDADCFLYVVQPNASLDDGDLELISVLYEHHRRTGKPVLWVLTAIDQARDLTADDQPRWKSTLEHNNAYLRQNYTEQDGTPDQGFLGSGFQPVSPASEARAVYLAAHNDLEESRYEQAGSMMESLRDTLRDLIKQTGPRHIAMVAAEAKDLVETEQDALAERLRTAQLPLDELEKDLKAQQERRRALDRAIPLIEEDLVKNLKGRVDAAAEPFDNLARVLHARLDEKIAESKPHSPKALNEIAVATTHAVDAWITSADGAASLWDREFAAFKDDDVPRALRRRLDDQVTLVGNIDHVIRVGDLGKYRFTPDDPKHRDLLQRAAAVIGVTIPLTAGGVWAFTALTALAVAVPAAALAGVAALGYAIVNRRMTNKDSQELHRQALIHRLDELAAESRAQFKLAATARGVRLIRIVLGRLDELSRHAETSEGMIRNRIADPEMVDNKEQVERLAPQCQQGEELVQKLASLLPPHA